MPENMPKQEQDEWDQAAGVVCPSCGRETLRLIEGACPQCHRFKVAAREIQMEDRAERQHVGRLFRQGKISTQDLRDGRY
jgi:predicted ATP-dependent serine protease